MSKYYLYDGVTGSYHETRIEENLDIREPPTDVEEFDGPGPRDVRSNSPELSASASRPSLWMSRSSRDLQYPNDHDQLMATGRADLGRPSTLDRAYTDPPPDTKRYDTDQPSDLRRYITDYDLPFTDQPSTTGQDDMNRTPPNPNIQILTPIDEKRPIHQKLPLSTQHRLSYLVSIPVPDDVSNAGEHTVYLEPEDQLMDRDQPLDDEERNQPNKVVYVWEPELEPKLQEIDRRYEAERPTFSEVKEKLVFKPPEGEVQFSPEEITDASPAWAIIAKAIAAISVIVAEFILNCITAADFGKDETDIEYEKKGVECEAHGSGSTIYIVFVVIFSFQSLFMALQIINIVGETLIDIKKKGFQIMHGFQETAISFIFSDIPLSILILVYHGQCSIKSNISISSMVMAVVKNFVRKNTARQKPKKFKIPLFFYSWVLHDPYKTETCSLVPRKWKMMEMNYFCCVLTGCQGEGCGNTSCCSFKFKCSLGAVLYFIALQIFGYSAIIVYNFAVILYWVAVSTVVLVKSMPCLRKTGKWYDAINEDYLRFQGLFRAFNSFQLMNIAILILELIFNPSSQKTIQQPNHQNPFIIVG